MMRPSKAEALAAKMRVIATDRFRLCEGFIIREVSSGAQPNVGVVMEENGKINRAVPGLVAKWSPNRSLVVSAMVLGAHIYKTWRIEVKH